MKFLKDVNTSLKKLRFFDIHTPRQNGKWNTNPSAIYLQRLQYDSSSGCYSGKNATNLGQQLVHFFSYFDQSDPFIRNIHENEIWKYQFQVTRSYVPNKCLWALLIIVPSILFIHDFCQNKNKKDVGYGCLALSLSYCLTALITAYLKVLTGRPRPDFYFRCFPQGSGNDYTLCTGKREIYMDGRKSFPSGHSSLAFACMFFVSLYLRKKFGLFEDNRRGESWQLCLCLVPILSAAAIAIGRTCDYHHHYEGTYFLILTTNYLNHPVFLDVVAGSLMGSVISYMCYKLYFPKTTSTFVQEIN